MSPQMETYDVEANEEGGLEFTIEHFVRDDLFVVQVWVPFEAGDGRILFPVDFTLNADGVVVVEHDTVLPRSDLHVVLVR
jgi:hypothetical protein